MADVSSSHQRSMDAALAEVRELASSAGEETRSKVVDSLRNTLYSLESEDESLERIMFLVRHLEHLSFDPTTRPTFAK